MSSASPVILWFRNDLRLDDHPALVAAGASGAPVLPVYVLDDRPSDWPMGAASRWWLHHSLARLDGALQALGSKLLLRRGDPVAVLTALAGSSGAADVHLSHHYEKQPLLDEAALRGAGLAVHAAPGNLLFEPGTILNGSGAPFKVFTPFYNACLAAAPPAAPMAAPAKLTAPDAWPDGDALEDWGLLPTAPDWAGGLREAWTPGESGALARLDRFLDRGVLSYRKDRDRPDREGTSRPSPHLHFGEISARQVWQTVGTHPNGDSMGGAAFLREVVWREFSAHLLFTAPTLPDVPLRNDFARFPWADDDEALRAWQRGQTGYPLLDAGMRELWHTGWMHNRVRMLVASFLVKHLRIHWRHGEAWFWDTLVDADLANNAASWQWVAGCGADAAPYFRIFNPTLQARKFDPNGAYIRRWVPELAQVPDQYLAEPWTMPPLEREAIGLRLGETYPFPIVDHATARKEALAALDQMKSNVA